MKFLVGLLLTCIFLPILFLIVFTPKECEHEEAVKQFSFQFEDSTSASGVKTYCKDCNENIESTKFRGTPDDLSYLEVAKQHTGADEILGGGYYTMTAIVTLGDFDLQRVRVNCKIESEGIIVGFTVEFREEFEESVSLLKEGDEITFRGRLYDNGFGFTDSELLSGNSVEQE